MVKLDLMNPLDRASRVLEAVFVMGVPSALLLPVVLWTESVVWWLAVGVVVAKVVELSHRYVFRIRVRCAGQDMTISLPGWRIRAFGVPVAKGCFTEAVRDCESGEGPCRLEATVVIPGGRDVHLIWRGTVSELRSLRTLVCGTAEYDEAVS